MYDSYNLGIILRLIFHAKLSTKEAIFHAKLSQTNAKLSQHEMSKRKGKRKVQGVPQSQTAALPRHQEEAEIDKTKQAQIEQMYEKH